VSSVVDCYATNPEVVAALDVVEGIAPEPLALGVEIGEGAQTRSTETGYSRSRTKVA
jgi:hypothetical protein